MRFFLRPPPVSSPATQGSRTLTFLGTAGFVLQAAGRTLVLDPYLTRAGLLRLGFGRLTPDEAAIQAAIPHADDVLIGHAHFDHVLDGPTLCRQTGARLIGSATTLHIGRAAGLPEAQLILANGPISCGPAVATPLPSRHGKVFPGRVPLPGHLSAPPPWPPRFFQLPHGDVYNWHIDVDGARVLHVDSADFIDDELQPADILCLCAVGRQYRQDYTRAILARVRPSVVIPCHWDDFTVPLRAAPRQLPGVDVESFVEEIQAAGARAVVLGPMQRFAW